MLSNNTYWFTSGSDCAYMDLAIEFAVNSVTYTSSNCTVYSCVSNIGLSDALPEVLSSMSRLSPVTLPLEISLP